MIVGSPYIIINTNIYYFILVLIIICRLIHLQGRFNSFKLVDLLDNADSKRFLAESIRSWSSPVHQPIELLALRLY